MKATMFVRLMVLSALVPFWAIAQSQQDAESSDETGKPQRLSFPVDSPWAAAVWVESETLGSKIAVKSHSGDYFELWQIDPARTTTMISRHDDVGYHPDSVYWIDVPDTVDAEKGLLLVVEGERELQLWLWNDGQLTKDRTLATKSPPRDADLGDFNNDGILDIVVSPYDEEPLLVLRGRGDLNFDQLLLDVEDWALHPHFVDWNQDGLVDIMWSQYKSPQGAVQVAFQNPQDSTEDRFIVEDEDATSTEEVIPAGNSEDDSVESQEKGFFDVKTIWEQSTSDLLDGPLPTHPRMLTIADLNADEVPDAVVAMELGKGALVLFNDGEGGIASSELIPADGDGFSWAAVYEKDGINTVALSELRGVLLARRDVESGEWQRRLLELGKGLLLLDLDFVDVDFDGNMDLVVADTTQDKVHVLFGPLWEQAQELGE